MHQSKSRPATYPKMPPPANSSANSLNPAIALGSRPAWMKPSSKMNSAIAAASFSRASPSTNQLRRRGVPRSRKTAITAAGSVVTSAKQEANDERHLGKWPQRKPNRSGGNEGRNHRKNQDRRSVCDSSFNVRGNFRFKNQQR